MLQRRATQFMVAVFVLSRLITLPLVQTEPYLLDAVAHYRQPQPYLVCTPDAQSSYVVDTLTYAVIPSILTMPDKPCEAVRKPADVVK